MSIAAVFETTTTVTVATFPNLLRSLCTLPVKLYNLKQCCGSGSSWIRIHIAFLDPDPYGDCGSGSKNMEIDQLFVT
jgi:hypothetical protein